MTDEERRAVEWFSQFAGEYASAREQGDEVPTIKRMLSAPRLPKPEELTEGELNAMCERCHWVPTVANRRELRGAYALLYERRTSPKTKTVERWHVEWAYEAMGWQTGCLAFPTREAAEREAAHSRGSTDRHCIRVTGPHTHLVPANEAAL